MREVVIAGAVRTPVGRIGGTLKDIPPQNLAALVMTEILKRTGVESSEVDEVVLGWSRQITEASNIARVAGLMAGYPETVPAVTVHRQCASGLEAIAVGTRKIATGECDVVVAGGTENQSRSPYYLKNARYGYRAGDAVLVDALTEAGPGSVPPEMYGYLPMGITAENVAERYNITRLEQDELALRSQTLAWKAIREGLFKEEIVPVEVKQRKKTVIFDTDEHPRETDMEKLAALPPAFKEGGTVTAGNSSGRNDAAAVVLLMSMDKAKELGVKPWARMVAHIAVGVDPEIMGVGPVPATRQVLKKAGLKLEDIDLIEINEAFAAQAVYCIKELGLDMEKTNVNGGAIALGHPVGATGARLMTTLLHEMRRRGSHYGLVTMCIGGGQGMAAIVEAI